MARDLSSSFRGNAIWAVLGTGFESIGLLALMVMMTKLLGAVEYGIWSLVVVVVTISIAVFTLQLPATLPRFLPGNRDPAHAANVVSVVLVCVLIGTIAGGLLVGLTAPWLANQFVGSSVDGATTAFRVSAAMIVAWGLEIAGYEIYRTFLRFRRYTLVLASRVSVEVLVTLGLLMAGQGLVQVLIGVTVVRVLSFGVTLGYVVSQVRGSIGRPRLAFLAPYLRYSLPFIAVALLTWFLKLSDRYVVAYFRPAEEVGIYSASYEIGMAVMLLIVPLRRTLYPSLSAAWNIDQMDEVGKLLKYSFRYFTLLALPLVVVLYGMADEIVRLLTQDEFVDLGRRVVPIIAAANLLFGLHAIGMFVLMLEKRIATVAGLMCVAAATNLALNMVLVPSGLGVLGAAVATLASFSILLALTVWTTYRRVSFGVEWSFYVKALVSSIVAGGAILLLDPNGPLGVIGGALLAALVYAGLMYALGAVTMAEIRFLLLGRALTERTELSDVRGLS